MSDLIKIDEAVSGRIAVSYTHLDVYKRQGAMFIAEEQGVDDSAIDVTPIEQPTTQVIADDYKQQAEPTPQATDEVASALVG